MGYSFKGFKILMSTYKYLKIDKNDCNRYSNCDASLYKNKKTTF